MYETEFNQLRQAILAGNGMVGLQKLAALQKLVNGDKDAPVEAKAAEPADAVSEKSSKSK